MLRNFTVGLFPCNYVEPFKDGIVPGPPKPKLKKGRKLIEYEDIPSKIKTKQVAATSPQIPNQSQEGQQKK